MVTKDDAVSMFTVRSKQSQAGDLPEDVGWPMTIMH